MPVYSREARDDEDFDQMRRLLMESYALNQRFHNWWLERLEGNRYHRPVKGGSLDWTENIRLWFNDMDKLVGFVNQESPDTYLQVHPRYRGLEPVMLEWAEKNHAFVEDGAMKVNVWAYGYDDRRNKLLDSMGYRRTGRYGYTRRRSLKQLFQTPPTPAGYRIRALTERGDTRLMADSLNLVFDRCIHTEEAYLNQQRAPTYREDLDLAMFTEDGTLASFATVWYHPENNIGVFEPVGTHPDHRRKGLSSVLMHHGMEKLIELGADYVYVGTGSRVPANRLYDSMGFDENDTSYQWSKTL
jgi:GNAT superfamily N-acetyltransferase